MDDNRSGQTALSSYGQAKAETRKTALQLQKNMRDSYHEKTNIDGIVNIGVAENTLMYEDLREYFERNLHLTPTDFTYGDGLTGTMRLCTAVSRFLNSYFEPYRPVVPDHLIMGSGLMTVLSQVTRVIADPGDGILLASPYYQGFDVSFTVQNGIIPIGVPIPASDMFTVKELTHLKRGLQESTAKGITIKAVMLCNPHNPLGRCYPPDVIIAYCRFCEDHNIHLLSDEVYALSVFPSCDVPDPEPFVSVLSIDLEKHGVNPSRVHALYGMSKDFNANGFRAGVFVSQSNPMLIETLTVTTIFMVISSVTDTLWSTLLMDESYLPAFITKNQLLLRDAYEYVTSWLRFHNLPYIPSSAGHFLMVDLRPVLSDVDRYASLLSITPEHNMRERELALARFLLAHKVSIIPGANCHIAEGGWFRLTFSVRRDFIDVALGRIETALGWDKWQPQVKSFTS
ncbi:hypothetical protein SERLA73DRAFT_178645 [Serpula lacrymans var. lacrymans S7.3]|uniref:Aminotransferase class I/classII large domain-containing protein n=2 Tax=Serpula lacrymans var. lacrymans TaxID=341189 RepID=F8PSC5_SERL3|nr:uncharacterized protein SERLADRAFT_463204 [Serpula lacrymans var. lacrymans S7.9]EGO00738.1 hypothetical protein SERLA73DRAFT_178645 [Serpula lacrymans var. lacrymans S7.3]EGO26303.1 hypothetical protein SERLADRAFT_463204 [Serpula lacrymans var. lacrymans S7.9]